MPIYRLNKQVYLDKFNKCYFNTISVSQNPNDPSLNHIITTISKQPHPRTIYVYKVVRLGIHVILLFHRNS